jgi:UDP-N-acetylmuramoylalanine--D-glutamate ligase
MEVRGRRATVMGLGRHGGGVAVARWLTQNGASVTITDLASADSLADSVAELADVEIAAWHLGGHREADFVEADLLVVNPAVRRDDPLVARAAARGAAITSELELFVERCPATVIGVTGSNGKSTTAAMIAEILRADGRETWLGGNIGRSLLPDLTRMSAASCAVLELSSFQLAWLSPGCPMPAVAVLTNFTPNHLDWHGTLSAYVEAKQRLFAGQKRADIAVAEIDHKPGGVAARNVPSWTVAMRGQTRAPWSDEQVPALRVPGLHNRRNAAFAAAAATAIGCTPSAIGAGLRHFSGLPDRLELVATVVGRDFYNDSSATTPESTIAALATFAGRAWLLAGGYDKGINLAPLSAAIAFHARGAAFFGATGPRLHALARAAGGADTALALAESLEAAFACCLHRSRPGDAIVLSPACAGYDQFVDYRARGERFRTLVRALDASPMSCNVDARDAHVC